MAKRKLKRSKSAIIPASVVAEQPKKPRAFTQELADKICERLIEGESLAEISRDALMPTRFAVFDWLNSNESFAHQYARARILQADTYVDSIKAIAADGSRDYVRTADGRLVPDHDHISRSRLQVDALKWIASRMVPKKYGDKLTTEISGPDGGPIETRSIDELSDTQLAAIAIRGRTTPTEPETSSE